MRGLGKHSVGHSTNGFTLIELLMTMAIMGVLLMLVTPSVKSMIDKQRVRGTCESIFESFALAKSSAISLNRDVTFNFRSPGASWCAGLYDASVVGGCNCSVDATACKVNGTQRSTSYLDFGGSTINVTGPADNTSVVFSARSPVVTPPSDILVKSSYWACQLKVEVLGQVRFMKKGTGANAVSVVPAAESVSLF